MSATVTNTSGIPGWFGQDDSGDINDRLRVDLTVTGSGSSTVTAVNNLNPGGDVIPGSGFFYKKSSVTPLGYNGTYGSWATNAGSSGSSGASGSEHFYIDIRGWSNGGDTSVQFYWAFDAAYGSPTSDPDHYDTATFILKKDWTYTITTTNSNGNYFELRDENMNLITDKGFVSTGVSFTNACFTTGARILMADGREELIENLRPGDVVETRDSGPQKIRWIGASKTSAETLGQFPNRRPIVFRKGALGDHEEFRVSLQHRILIEDDAFLDFVDNSEGLVRAKHLVNDHSILVDNSLEEITYFHILFDKHEIIRADGIWSESFYPGEYTMKTAEEKVREEVVFHFPELEKGSVMDAYGDTARPVLTGKQVRISLGSASS